MKVEIIGFDCKPTLGLSQSATAVLNEFKFGWTFWLILFR